MTRTVRCLSVLLLAGWGLAPTAAAQTYFVKAASIHTAAGAPLSPGQLLVKDGKIAQIGSDLTPPAGVRVIDLKEGVLIPGLVDGYSERGVAGGAAERTRELTPRFKVGTAVDWKARDFKEALAAGVTCQLIAPDTQNVISGQGCVAKSAGAKKDRVLNDELGLFLTTTSDPGAGNSSRSRPDSIYNRLPTNRMGVIWMLRQQFAKAKADADDADLEPLRQAQQGGRPAFAVARTQFEIESLFRVADEAGLKKLVLVDGFECYRLAPELKERKIPVLLDPLTSTVAQGGENEKHFWNQPQALHEAGVLFALTGPDLLGQAQFAVRNGLPKEAALAAITKTPAEILGVAGRVGSLAVGRDADFVALSGDPFDFTTTVRFTAVGGVLFGKE